MRTVCYARYSTELQRDTSIEDQVRNCERFAERHGWVLGHVYSDRAISGSSRHRPEYQRMLAAAAAGEFDVLLIDDLSRLSRDDIETKQTIRRLKFLGMRIVGVSEGFDTEVKGYKIHAGMRGMANEMYLDDLREKTHRGLTGQVLRGFSAGGVSYGYRSIPVGKDAEDGHRLEVDQERATWVRWIFEHYAAGWSCQRIAIELNRLQVESPRGTSWAVSALYGSPAKGSGILNNELYVGRYIWNRSQWVKDPETDRRIRNERPADEWMIHERPELRIVTDDLWQAARARLSTNRLDGGSRGRGARPRTLFGGILRCGVCNGPMVAVNARAYGCTNKKDRGTCTGVLVTRKHTDTRLLTVIREELLAPASLVNFQKAAAGIMAQRNKDAVANDRQANARLSELDREIGHLVNAIAQVGISPSLKERLTAAETEQRSLMARLQPTPVAETLPNLTARYRELLANLGAALTQDVDQARPILRELLGEIRLVPENGEVWAEVETRADRLLVAAGAGPSMEVVAGAGFEPTTFGL